MLDSYRTCGFIVLGVSLAVACSSSDSGSNKTGDGGSDDGAASSTGGGSGNGGRANTGGAPLGGASPGGRSSSTGGGSTGGGTANTGGQNTNTGGTAGTDGGTAGAGGRSGGGAGGTNPGGPCDEIALCCPTSGIFRPTCEQYATTGTGPECAVLRGLFCGGVLDAGNPPGGDAGDVCAQLAACCGTLTGTNRTQCEEAATSGVAFACGLVLPVLCP